MILPPWMLGRAGGRKLEPLIHSMMKSLQASSDLAARTFAGENRAQMLKKSCCVSIQLFLSYSSHLIHFSFKGFRGEIAQQKMAWEGL